MTIVLPGNNVSRTTLDVLPTRNMFEAKKFVLPLRNVSEAMSHVLPIYIVQAAKAKTNVLCPKKGRVLAFLGECGILGDVPTKHVRNREFSDSAQFYILIGSQGLRLLVSGVDSRECVLVGTPTGAALCCFHEQRCRPTDN